MMYDRRRIKRTAREAMRRTRPRPWKVTFLYLLLVGLVVGMLQTVSAIPAITAVADLVKRGYFVAGRVAASEEALLALAEAASRQSLLIDIISVVVFFLSTALTFGYCGWAIRVYTGREAKCGTLFSGFRVIWKAIAVNLLTALFTTLWSLIFMIPGVILIALVILYTAWGSIPLVVGWIVVGVLLIAMLLGELFVSYRYSLAPFFVMATPKMGVMEAIRASREDMRGNFGRRFMLDLSFIGWEIVTGIIAGAAASLASGLVAWGGLSVVQFSPYDVDAFYSADVMFWALLAVLAGVLAGELVSLPMRLWLTGYRQVSAAGFFCAVSGYWSPAGRDELPLLPTEEGPAGPGEPEGEWRAPSFPIWGEDGIRDEDTPPEPPAAPEPPVIQLPAHLDEPAEREPEGPPVPPAGEEPQPEAPPVPPQSGGQAPEGDRDHGYRQPFQWGYEPPKDGN